MATTDNHFGINAARAYALFVSPLQRSGNPSAGQVRQATAAALRQFGGQGCAERVAQEFGDHPELAAARMRWARLMVARALSEPVSPSSSLRAVHQHIGHAA